jgi:hypothetical protein
MAGDPMTCDVIDVPRGCWLPGFMDESTAHDPVRYDGTLRTVMWLDAFLSAAVVVVGVVLSPVAAAVGVPAGMALTLGLATIGCAVLLAALGAITGVLLMVRLAAGEYLLPARLRLPLPAAMRPELGPADSRTWST